jgi:large subunit ribosomal protein L18e
MKSKNNPVLNSLVDDLIKEKRAIWKRLAKELSRSRRMRVEVNLSKIDHYAQEGSTIVVPGIVLGSGTISKKGMTVAAFRFSASAKKLIREAQGNVLTIENLKKSNPEGKGIMILK